MATVRNPVLLIDEIAEFLASCPSREQILNYHPSQRMQQRVRELLAKLKSDRISTEEQRELDQIEHAEALMQLIKARLRSPRKPKS
jgi:hypothetical protein